MCVDAAWIAWMCMLCVYCLCIVYCCILLLICCAYLYVLRVFESVVCECFASVLRMLRACCECCECVAVLQDACVYVACGVACVDVDVYLV